jgi:hypothetical protein
MRQQFSRRARARAGLKLFIALLICTAAARAAQQTQTPAPSPAPTPPAVGSPARVVLDFYHALRERKFREAFAMSIYRGAIEGLPAQEFEELRPEFEKMAASVPEQIEISGEQISGDEATVFTRAGGDPSAQLVQEPALRVGGVWLYGNREAYQVVQSKGAAFFPETRIERHHEEVGTVLRLIAEAEAAYALQHGGAYADLPALIASKASLKDDVESDTLGYTFRVLLSRNAKTYAVEAVPARYGRTGRLSFYMDASGYKSKDAGGKPFTPPGVKRP